MKSFVLTCALLTLAAGAALAGGIAPAQTRDTVHFTDVTLRDGEEVYEGAEIYVRVKESATGGYTRADYLDRNARRLGFYEVFEVVSRDEAVLRDWAIRNFPDRTSSKR